MSRSAYVLLILALCAGCQRGRPVEPVEHAPAPTHSLEYDEALALRDWLRNTAHYGCGDVIAGPTNNYYRWEVGDPTESSYMTRQRAAIVTEPLIALGQMIVLPVSLIIDPPTERRRYEGTFVGPTYTAAVPPEELQRETTRGRREADRAAREARQAAPEPGAYD